MVLVVLVVVMVLRQRWAGRGTSYRSTISPFSFSMVAKGCEMKRGLQVLFGGLLDEERGMREVRSM